MNKIIIFYLLYNNYILLNEKLSYNKFLNFNFLNFIFFFRDSPFDKKSFKNISFT